MNNELSIELGIEESHEVEELTDADLAVVSGGAPPIPFID